VQFLHPDMAVQREMAVAILGGEDRKRGQKAGTKGDKE
jgi:hypothetical protein